ncbi:hypothetical protein BD560DRAFT_399851 [Blakeslea trispora]|nr:hypothetical protein BD560DRAFT_399851 [Blakeslea trispora]
MFRIPKHKLVHRPLYTYAARPRVSTHLLLPTLVQQRSISFIPTVARVAFSAVRVPLFLAGTAVAGATVATNKLQDMADKGSEFLSDAKNLFSSIGESIDDFSLNVPEINIKLSDLLSDVFNTGKDKPKSVNHIITSPEENSAKDDTADSDIVAIQQLKQQLIEIDKESDQLKQAQEIEKHQIVKEEEEEEEEEIDQEALAKDEAARMKYQDQQFMLFCKKFATIRDTLISIRHRVIPFIPSIVVVGSRGNHSSTDISIIESILGQPFLEREAYGQEAAMEYSFVNNPSLTETKIQIEQEGEETPRWCTVQEAQTKIAELLSKDKKSIKLIIQGPTVPYLNLYDLPEHTLSLYDQYIGRDPNSIIVAIYDTQQPSKDTFVAKICDRYDPFGRRTVGLLTKHEEEAQKEDALVEDHLPALGLGYIDLTHQETDRENGQRILRSHLLTCIEQSMGRSIYSIVDTIKSELEESSYLFKVMYNDQQRTATSYLTDSLDELKLRFKEFTTRLGKPQLRYEVRRVLEQNVLNICAEQYWSDAKILELSKAPADDFYWLYKMDLACAAITKSGIGRITTQLVMNVVMKNMNNLVKMEPFQFHPDVQQQIIDLTEDLLRQKYVSTSDQVENTIKPYKYEVEVTAEEWKEGVKKTVHLLEKELAMCEDMLWTLKKSIGRKRLRSAIKRVLDEEKSDQFEDTTTETTTVGDQQPSRILEKAREALFLQDRAMILKYRLAALKSRQCKSFENRQFCPEAFLNIIAEKLTYTAVMFIQIELLNDFFFDFPVEVIDNQIIYPMSSSEIEKFAKENPTIQKHLILQEKKMKLQEVMDMLNYLVRRHDIHPPSSKGYYSSSSH